jgi:hypothetical protein
MDYPEIREKSDITDIRSISELKRDLRNLKKTVEKIYALNPK